MYFKITNEKENHHGLQYHDGVIEDVVRFNSDPNSSCSPGGIYFSDEKNIDNFFNYGTWIRQVEIPEGAQCIKDRDGDKWRASKLFFHPRRELWSVETFQWLIDNGLNINARGNEILAEFACDNNLEVVKFLVEQGANIHYKDDLAFRRAARDGHIKTAKYLYSQGANINADNIYALRYAAYNGQLEVISFLIDSGIKYSYKSLSDLNKFCGNNSFEFIMNQKTGFRNELIKLRLKAKIFFKNIVEKYQ